MGYSGTQPQSFGACPRQTFIVCQSRPPCSLLVPMAVDAFAGRLTQCGHWHVLPMLRKMLMNDQDPGLRGHAEALA
jgi:hypothetical protein